MPWDDLAWEQSDARADAWEKAQLNGNSYRAVAKFINQYKPGKALSSISLFEEATMSVTA